MWLLCAVIRLCGLLLGLFAVLSGVADVAGFLPYSDATPPWTERLLSNLPMLVGGLILLLPINRFLAQSRFRFLLGAYLLLLLAVLALAAQGVIDYRAGLKHWVVLWPGLIILSVVAGHIFVLWHWRQHPRAAA